MLNGGMQECPARDLKPYATKYSELSIKDDIILLGARVVIPCPAERPILQQLHNGHPGVSKIKMLARSEWPGIDGDIEKMVKNMQNVPRKSDDPTISFPTPLGMARKSMRTGAWGFHRTIYGFSCF